MSYFWMQLTSSMKFLGCLVLSVITFVLATWDKVGPKDDPLVAYLSQPNMYIYTWGAFIIAVLISFIYLGIDYWRYKRIVYKLTPAGIVFGAGIQYAEDLVAWQIINDVDLTRSIPEQLLNVGTLWVSADGGIHMPLLYLKEYKELRARLTHIVRSNYGGSRRVTRLS